MNRSQVMARVKSKDTQPELTVRKAFYAAGLRYRLHVDDLPGKPDIVLAGKRLVVFVHGCFFHSHPGCGRARMPSTRQEYWVPKLARNRERDAANEMKLVAEGWKVLTIWECETRRAATLQCVAETIRAMPIVGPRKMARQTFP